MNVALTTPVSWDGPVTRTTNDENGSRKRDPDSGSITRDSRYYGPEFGYYDSYKRDPEFALTEEVYETLCMSGEFSSENCLPSDSTSEVDKRNYRKRDPGPEDTTSSDPYAIELEPANWMEESVDGIAPSKRDPQQSC